MKKIENFKLWQSYKEEGDQKAREELIKGYLSLVKYQAGRVKMMIPDFISRQDLESFGIIGLLDALEKFDHTRGIKFTTYASMRIRGEIIDHLRKMDWLPHSLRKEGRKIREAAERLTQKLGRKPTAEELSREVDLEEEQIKNIYYKLFTSRHLSLFADRGEGEVLDFIADSSERKPENIFREKVKKETLARAIDRLEEQERLVITLYYYEELTQKEIAEIMELTPARISQLHKKAVYRLRGFLNRKKELLI